MKKIDFDYTPVGSKQSSVYERVYDEKLGKTFVQKTKDFDIDEFIQASVSTSDLSQLRQEMAASGLIPQVSADVVDYSLFPQNIHELNDVVNSVAQRYNALPDEIKKCFPSVDSFQASLIKGTFETDIINYYKVNPVKPTQEVKEIKKDE